MLHSAGQEQVSITPAFPPQQPSILHLLYFLVGNNGQELSKMQIWSSPFPWKCFKSFLLPWKINEGSSSAIFHGLVFPTTLPSFPAASTITRSSHALPARLTFGVSFVFSGLWMVLQTSIILQAMDFKHISPVRNIFQTSCCVRLSLLSHESPLMTRINLTLSTWTGRHTSMLWVGE